MKKLLLILFLLPFLASPQVPTFTLKGGGGGSGSGITKEQRDSINRALDSVNAKLLGYVPKETGKRLFSEDDEVKLMDAYNRPLQDLSAYSKKTDTIASQRILDAATALFSATVSMGMVAASNRHLMFTPVAIIVTDAREIVSGTSPSVTYSVKYGPSRSNPTGFILNSRTVTSTAGQAATPLATTNTPANSWIWVEVTATSGTVNDFGVTITYN